MATPDELAIARQRRSRPRVFHGGSPERAGLPGGGGRGALGAGARGRGPPTPPAPPRAPEPRQGSRPGAPRALTGPGAPAGGAVREPPAPGDAAARRLRVPAARLARAAHSGAPEARPALGPARARLAGDGRRPPAPPRARRGPGRAVGDGAGQGPGGAGRGRPGGKEAPSGSGCGAAGEQCPVPLLGSPGTHRRVSRLRCPPCQGGEAVPTEQASPAGTETLPFPPSPPEGRAAAPGATKIYLRLPQAPTWPVCGTWPGTDVELTRATWGLLTERAPFFLQCPAGLWGLRQGWTRIRH